MIVGIDPGIGGAIAAVSDGGREAIYVDDMPIVVTPTKTRVSHEIDAAGLARMLRAQIGLERITTVIVERVHAMPDQGVSSMLSLGDSKGVIRGVCAALGLSVQYVEPQRWKRHAGLVKADKDASRCLALQLWPAMSEQLKLKKHHGRAEALLIARFGALVLNAEFEPMAVSA